MRKILFVTSLTAMVLAISCNDKTIQDLNRAEGKVAGEDWVFEKGSAVYGINEVTIVLMNGDVQANDPCSVFKPASPYVKFTIPARTGSYNIPFSNADKSVKFFEGSASAKSYTSTSGYVQIVSVNEFTVDGIIQASFDEDNDIVGAFFVQSCN